LVVIALAVNKLFLIETFCKKVSENILHQIPSSNIYKQNVIFFPDRKQIQFKPEDRQLRPLRRDQGHRSPPDFRLDRRSDLHPDQPGQIDQPLFKLRERSDRLVSQTSASNFLDRDPDLPLHRFVVVARAVVVQHRWTVVLRG